MTFRYFQQQQLMENATKGWGLGIYYHRKTKWKIQPTFNPILLNGKPLEEVTSAKLLGLNISSDLKWNIHVLELVKKASCRLYFLRQLKEITDYACGVNTFLHHMHSFYSRICMSHVPSCSPGLPQRGPGETAKTCIANYLPWYVIQSGPRIFRFANPL